MQRRTLCIGKKRVFPKAKEKKAMWGRKVKNIHMNGAWSNLD